MKKIIGSFSLVILLFSTFAPFLTYASEAENEAKQILIDTLDETMSEFNENIEEIEDSSEKNKTIYQENGINSLEESNNEIEIIIMGENNHVLWNKTKGLITVYSSNYSSGITMSDKNLGATKYVGQEGVSDEEVIGNYYQWGNNDAVTAENFHSSYYNQTNNWLICGSGFHIPESEEWEYIVNTYGLNGTNYSLFNNDLKLTLGGMVNDSYDGNLQYNTNVNKGGRGFFRTNTNIEVNEHRIFVIKNSGTYSQISDVYYSSKFIGDGTAGDWLGLNVRCFKDEYEPFNLKVTFHPNGGYFSGMENNETKKYEYTANENGIVPIYNIQIPDRKAVEGDNYSGWMFAGWYTKSGDNNDWGEEFDISDPNSTIAYAKWLPFNDLKLSEIGLPGVYIMDRNLGAELEASGTYYGYNVGHEDNNKLGYYYQWGNNYGFRNVELSIKTGNQTISNPDNMTKPRGPNNSYYNNQFVGRVQSPYRWNSEENLNLWGGKDNKNSDIEKKGPCPQGYHVPDTLEWNAIYKMIQENQTILCDGETPELWKCFAKKLELPFAGTLNSNNGVIAGQGNYGNYWSANPFSINNSYHISFGTYTNIQDNSSNAAGKSVRCFKSNTKYNSLKLNIGDEDENMVLSLRRWEPIGFYLGNIEKIGYDFLGRYDDSLFLYELDTNSTINNDKTIFAKWNPHHYTLKFDINGGTGEINNINATYGEETILPTATREGYIFKGRKSENGTIYTNSIPEGTGLTTEDGVVVTLTAQWEEIKEIIPSAGGGSIINPSNQKSEITEQEHNSANTENTTEQENTKTTDTQTTNNPTIKEQVKKVEERSLTRGEIAVMTDILLEVFPQLVESRELQDVTKACSSYVDEQNFTKDEKKAITRLCRLSIMGIHNDDNKPLDEFLVKQKATNGEFATVMDRVVSDYNEKDLATVKEALKKLENDEESVVFGTVYDVFMSIKNIFN